jgi:hypothetical protein
MDDNVGLEGATPSRFERWALPAVSLVACALFVVCAIRFYLGAHFAGTMNSDAAVPVLLADEVLRTGRPVPSTWYFGNDEIWTLAPHLFALPFVAAIGVSTLALKFGNFLCLGVMVWFLALCMRRVTRSWPYAMLVAAGVFAAFSAFQEQAVYSQTAYGWFTALFAVLIYLALRIQDERGGDTWRLGDVPWSVGLYVFVLLALTVESPMRAAAYWVVPLVAVTLIFPIARVRSRALAGWTLCTFLAGALLHHIISQHVLSQAGLTVELFKPFAEWRANLVRIWVGLPLLTGSVHAPYVSLPGALDRIRFCVFVVASVVVMIAPVGRGPCSTECRFLARVSASMLLVALAALTVGQLNVGPESDRYLIPPALLSTASFMGVLWCRFRAHIWALSAVAALFVLMFCGSAVMFLSSSGPIALDRPCDGPANVCELESVLATTGVRRGFATYWKGNATTLLSSGRIKVCGVLLRPRLVPFRWLTPKDCFDTPAEARFFFALDRTEIATAGRDLLVAEVGKPDEIVTRGAYEVWIYTTANAKLGWLSRP